ncbi:MAG: GNAT family N-acetyltransferase [Asgard group archaeon]|nr:GNAT family N-acetyltransferase [Asgard group archaeon]
MILFDGKKVRLRSLELTDLDLIMEHWNKIDLRRELGPIVPHSRKEREDWIRKTWENRRIEYSYTFAIEDIKSGELLGHCSLNRVRAINRTASVSIAIYNQKNRGKGYGTDAMRVLLSFGFDYINLHRIGLNVFNTNPSAIHVYEKVGFKRVGELRHTDFVEGQYVNDVVMDILEDEWREIKKKE